MDLSSHYRVISCLIWLISVTSDVVWGHGDHVPVGMLPQGDASDSSWDGGAVNLQPQPSQQQTRKVVVGGSSEVDLRMPSIRPVQEDQYICTSFEISPGKSKYITEFTALATADVVHHMLLFGCSSPYSDRTTWQCGPVCKTGPQRIIYAWARNAPPTTVPKDVGFEIGTSTGTKHLVLQIHYKNPLPTSEPADTSGMAIKLTETPQPNIAGIFLLASRAVMIPPNTPVVHADISCQYTGRAVLHPIAYRTHTHDLGVVVTGYRFDGQYHLIGKGNPQWPQAFYPAKNPQPIMSGDYMIGRCTYNSTGRNRYTNIGATHKDEMCNFYLMYYTAAANGVSYLSCGSNDYPELSVSLPAESDQPLPPNPLLDRIANGHGDGGHHHHHHEEEQQPEIQPEQHIAPNVPHQTPQHTTLGSIVDNGAGRINEIAHEKALKLVPDWLQLPNNVRIGQIGGIATDSKGNVHVFHRGPRIWNYLTFNNMNVYIGDMTPITENTILTFDPSGKLINQWGSNMFYLPHGFHIDDKDNVWLTDVALHQVFRFPFGSSTPDLVLGVRMVPGSDLTHFCKPTDVATLANGQFFVSDGYCNYRVMKFDANGKLLHYWGQRSTVQGADGYPAVGSFDFPHGITALPDVQQVCVADRQNGRIQCFGYDGSFKRQIHPAEFNGAVYGVSYSVRDGVLYVVNGPNVLNTKAKMSGFTINPQTGALMEMWGPEQGFSQPHDIAVSKDGGSVYVGELLQNKLWKFSVKQDLVDAFSGHKTVKKAGVSQLPPSSSDDKGKDVDIKTNIDSSSNSGSGGVLDATGSKHATSTTDQKKTSSKSSFGVSMLIGALLVVPVMIIVIATIIIRLYRTGKLPSFLGQDKHNRRFNLGSFLQHPNGKGFTSLNTHDSDELNHLNSEESEDEVEEFNATPMKA